MKRCKLIIFKEKRIFMKTFIEPQFGVMYFMSFKDKGILMKTLVGSQFEVM